MSNQMAFITHTAAYLPERVLSNADLEKMVDTSDDWIVSRTGIRERRLADHNEFTSDMGAKAAKKCLDKAGLVPQDLDLIIVATLTPDHIFPSTACLIQEKLGGQNIPAFDMQAACSGFLYALATAKAFIESGVYRRVLVVGSEKLSSIVDYQDRSTCVLFGDGAAACLVDAQGPGLRIREFDLGADGEQNELLALPAGGCKTPASAVSIESGQHYLKMDGREIFKHAVRRMEQSMKKCMEKSEIKQNMIDWFIPHQANMRIIKTLAKRCCIEEERVVQIVEKYGNTSASSIGIGMDELWEKDKIAEGHHLLLVAFGAGLTWGSMILTMEGGR